MNIKRIGLGLLLIIFTGSMTFYYPKIQRACKPPLHLHRLPPEFALSVFSFGNKELMACVIFYNTEFYFGEKAGSRKEIPEYKIIYDALNKATDLDPYNMDCYYFAQGALSWIKPAIPVLNRLLIKGLKHRTWDWYLPFFIGANYYFQLKDPLHAAQYMKQAAKLNYKSPILATLTARMFYQGNQTQAGILYLKSLIAETSSPVFKKQFKKRLHALEAILFLEQGVKRYKTRFGKTPKNIREMLTTGMIDNIPADPYGGRFYIDNDGKILTTSKLAEAWKKKDIKRNDGHSDINAKESLQKGNPEKTGGITQRNRP